PAYVESLTRDHRMVHATTLYMQWFYHETATVFSRSNQYRFNLRDLGLSDDRLRTLAPGLNMLKFAPLHRDVNLFTDLGVREPLGQVVMEAHACGLPAVVSNEGGPKETVDHEVSGLVLPATDARVWAAALDQLLSDEPRRSRMARCAPQRVARFSLERTFESFWIEHLLAAEPPAAETPVESPAKLPAGKLRGRAILDRRSPEPVTAA